MTIKRNKNYTMQLWYNIMNVQNQIDQLNFFIRIGWIYNLNFQDGTKENCELL